MKKKKRVTQKTAIITAIIIEIVLVVLFISSCIDLNAKCDGINCLGQAFNYLLIYISGVLAVINLFIIQLLRKKSLIVPIIVLLCIMTIFIISICVKNIYIKTTRFKPENNIEDIFNNDSSKTHKYIYYFVHNNYLYYYKYDENYIDNTKDKKGILFKTDFNLNKTNKICELNNSINFDFDFIYNNEVFYTTRERDCDECDYHDSLKRLNLDTCKEKNVIDYDGKTNGEWNYILGSRNNNEILFYDRDSNSNAYILYKYDLKEDKIIKSSKINNIVLDTIDYDNFDYYYTNRNGIYYNDNLIYEFNDSNYLDLNIISFDTENIYLASTTNIYILNKNTKELSEKGPLPFDKVSNISDISMFMNSYTYIDNKIYQYNKNTNSFITPFDNINEDNMKLFSRLYSEQRNINGYYLFSDISELRSSDSEYRNNESILSIYDNRGNNIIKEYNNGKLINYFVDNDDIYLVYNDNTIKKIETKK